MTTEEITQLKKDFESFKQAKNKMEKMNSVIKHVGEKGRNDEIGVYLNNYNINIQTALQYKEGGQNYYSDDELNREFERTVKENFTSLMDKTIYRINLEYNKSKSVFEKYKITEI